MVSKAEGIVGGDNYCLNLRQFGLDRTYCLTDIATFCNRCGLLSSASELVSGGEDLADGS